MSKLLFNIAGTTALVLAVIGVFLPLLPTTPFLLLALACYMRGSPRMHAWMLEHRLLGPYLSNWQNGLGISRRTKVVAIIALWVSLSFSAWLLPVVWIRALLLISGLAVTVYLLRMKTLDMSG